MSRVKNVYLNDFVTNQFPVEKFKEMIIAYLNIVESFQLILDDKDYNINITQKYEMRLSSTRKPTNSKVESFIINKYDNKEKMEDCILKYPIAFNNLNDMERKVFTESILNNKKDIEVIEELGIYSNLLSLIRKSAIVRFSLSLGFDKFVKYF